MLSLFFQEYYQVKSEETIKKQIIRQKLIHQLLWAPGDQEWHPMHPYEARIAKKK